MFKPALILKTKRSNVEDLQFFGFINLFSKEKNLLKIGVDDGALFLLRSLAKPFQASVMADFKTHEFYNFTKEEIAISAASHIGDCEHTQHVLGILNKIGLSEDYLQCGTHKPLIDTIQNPAPINNNCSGKHAMMLAVCKQQGYDINSYLDPKNPLQKEIYKKHLELCACSPSDMVLSYDGCNAPIYAIPLKNLALGYLNLFLDEKYKFLKDAYLKCPDIMGGQNRTDSVIIKSGGGKLIAKVGAGGFLAVLNLESKEVLIIKMTTEDYKAREVAAQNMLLKLGWIKEKFFDTAIKTSCGIPVGEWEFTS